MILEVAILNIVKGQTREFEQAFVEAGQIISTMEGYLCHQLLPCLENDHRYILLVEWKTLEHHTIGFRGSTGYQTWKSLLHHFYEPFPTVEHYIAMGPKAS
ncbi:antibiotic biosynthesis monooxygenase [Pedobacter panaciterrae]|uniref:Antibiotic biosynthesis monooxygenase n=1 Tax=Pedobacter panaciterrae TaxID=363849 RepID=A0ABU8NRK8_9SPHI|nr:antibiotic biosynthesis monooxygenase [uncultured Pedobacter sp.]